MATAPDMIEQAADTQPEAVDYEAEARKMGWSPLDEFKGDPKHHLDAETFYTRAVEYMPIAKATIKKLSERIDRMDKDARKRADFFSKGEQRAYERALAEIRAEQEAAVESGDLEAHRRAAEKLDKLDKPGTVVGDDDEDRRTEEFADWGKANKWYATNSVMQAYADAQAQKLVKAKGGGFLDRDDLDDVAAKVKAKFADEFPEDLGMNPRPKPRNPVEGVTAPRGRSGGKSFADLPAEAQRMCDKWVKNGTIKSRDDYIKNYAW